jgi:hypothetical protein
VFLSFLRYCIAAFPTVLISALEEINPKPGGYKNVCYLAAWSQIRLLTGVLFAPGRALRDVSSKSVKPRGSGFHIFENNWKPGIVPLTLKSTGGHPNHQAM